MSKKEKRLIRRRLVRSYIASVVSISLVLLLVGAMAIFWGAAGSLARHFKENLIVSVILSPAVEEEAARTFAASLEGRPDVLQARFISRQEGEDDLKKLLGEDFLSAFSDTAIPLSIDLRLPQGSVSGEAVAALKTSLEADERVSEVVYQESLVEALNANLRTILMVLAVAIILLLVVSFVLISNTVRLNLHSRRFTIHTMRQVGARNSFIRRPFLLQALLQGAVSGGIAAAALYAGMRLLETRGGVTLGAMFASPWAPWVPPALVVLGIILCTVSARIVLSRILHTRKEDLYY